MIDYTSINLNSFSMEDFKKLLELLDLQMPQESEKMKVKFENLLITFYTNSNKLNISNSLHKFYNRTYADLIIDGNYNDFCYSNFNELMFMFSEFYFERDLKDFNISTKFETGVNIDLGAYKPMEIMEKFESYQVCNSINSFETIDTWGGKVGKPIMRKSFLYDYQLKAYSKSAESNLTNVNLLRFEIVYGSLKKLRSVLQVNDITLETLTNIDSWKGFGDYLDNCYRNIKKIPLIDRDLTIDELNKVYAYCSKNFKKDISKHLSRHNYTKYMNECKEVYLNISQQENNFQNTVENKISSKIKYLCSH